MVKKLFSVFFLLFIINLIHANSTPVLSDFRVENAQKNRVYFNSSVPLTNTSVTTTGFVISGKTITSITVNSGQTNGHFFTVSSPFTFWDNNTIRYSGGSSLNCYRFDLQNINNNIDEPTATNIRYVTASASGGGDGTSESSAWTFLEAGRRAVAGQTVYIKAGNYGNINVIVENSGSLSSPIKFIGYTNTPGDNPNLNWSYPNNTTFNSNLLPLLRGNDELQNRGLEVQGEYVIVKNIQIENYDRLLFIQKPASNVWVDNMYVDKGTYGILQSQDDGHNVRITNSVVYRTRTAGIRCYGNYNKIENNKIYDDRYDGNNGYSNDYYIVIRGSNSIVRGNYIERVGNTTHTGHGLSMKSRGNTTEYNLSENNEAVGIKLAIELWGVEVQHNVVRNIKSWRRSSTTKGETGGIDILGGARNNIIDRVYVDNTGFGIYFESGGNTIVKNSIFRNNSTTIRIDNPTTGNTFINCNFDNNGTITSSGGAGSSSNNKIINTNITNISKSGSIGGFSFDHCNFWNSFATPSGAANISKDPKFINSSAGDYKLQDSSEVKDAGNDSNLVNFSFDGTPRVQGKYSIGAYEDETPSVGNVSSDATICEGETTTLIASGGTSYQWSTGETTASITVSPSTTTTYSVTISDGSDSDSHDVVVTVNAAPTVDAGTDETICEGESVVLTATGTGDFTWSTGETGNSITVNPSNTTTYTVTASNSCSTEVTDQVVVNVNPGVTVDAGADVSVCQGESVTLTATGTGNFTWSTGETTASITVNPTSTTTYSITTTNGSCSSTDDVVVTVNTPPTVNVGADQTICEGESVVLTATGVGNFTWSTGETGNSITVSPSSTTTYTVTASNACSTNATDQVVVNVNPGVTVDAGADVSVCEGESVVLTATGTGNFTWSTGETTASITVNPASSTTYSVTTTNGNCSLTDDVVVTVNTSPTVNAGADKAICEGDSVTLTATGTGDFTWSNGETGRSITVSPSVTTTYSVTATSNGCQSTAIDYVEVAVSEQPNLSTTDNVTIESGESITLEATGNGSFKWSTGETTSSITVSPTNTTDYTVTLTAAGGCSERNTIRVTVVESSDNGSFVAYAGEDVVMCPGKKVVLTASGGDAYLWSTGETERSITVEPTESTIYSVKVTKGENSDTAYVKVTIDPGCTTTGEKEMLLYPNPTEGLLNIDLIGYENNTNLQLFNLSGKMVYSDKIKNNNSVSEIKHQIDLSKLTKGIYLLRLTNKGSSEVQKVIIR